MIKKNLSIIVPIYNQELSLDNCIQSIINQKEKNIEILLINDGSADRSDEICRKWKEQYPLVISYYKQENGGVSSARNLGIMKAQGNYIQFVDADDTVEMEYSSKMLENIGSADLVISGYNLINNGIIFSSIDFNEKKYSYNEFVENILSFIYPDNVLFSPWNKLYSLKKIKKYKIQFIEGCKIGEDALFNLQYISESNQINMITDTLYNYETASTGSATSISKLEWFSSNYEILKEIKKILMKNNILFNNSNNYTLYSEYLTSIYITRLFFFKRQKRGLKHFKQLHYLLKEYEKWGITTNKNQKKMVGIVLYFIEKRMFLFGTLYVVFVRTVLSIKNVNFLNKT